MWRSMLDQIMREHILQHSCAFGRGIQGYLALAVQDTIRWIEK